MMDHRVNEINYRTLVPRKNGFVFKFVKINNDFINTYIEGDLLEKLALTPSMVIGKTLFDFLPKDIAARKNKFYETAWNGKTINYEGYVNGVYYLASLSPLIVNSQVVEVSGIAIDITKEKNNEKKIREMEKLSIVGELAAGVAHEIRNPLTSIKGFTQIIKENINDEKLKEYLSIMLDDLDRISNIVNEFMFISKPKETMEIKQIEINMLISNVIHFMEPQSNLKSICVSTDFDKTIVAQCDPNQLKQVLINLLQNAIEASSDNKNIEVLLKEIDDHFYMIQITDNGCGMSSERQKRLFEPFYTTKEKGTGLGLMMCKRIIETHNGTIDVKSKERLGTVVKIVLPLSRERI
ncbi:ATP-binding protein [Metabacillus bambusae]|uniref:histidine kinase n=1 Tax=Metabacillus bambusae TaxID=2795218 RepID=A0ABS3MW21_9BACI|nr:ATP-binding protein [Metabacillus bambusae]MBO1510209.1 GHKL domain-containing protein [Metabacillus bambusae]